MLILISSALFDGGIGVVLAEMPTSGLAAKSATSFSVGDYFYYGEYNEKPLKWRVTQAVNSINYIAMLANPEQLPAMKFSNSDPHNGYAEWAYSYIRTYLNGSFENAILTSPTAGETTFSAEKIVDYELGNPASTSSFDYLTNAGYDVEEMGGTDNYEVLSNTDLSLLSGTFKSFLGDDVWDYYEATDRYFLPDIYQIAAIYNSSFRDFYKTENSYLLRTWTDDKCQNVAIVKSDGSIDKVAANIPTNIRPAFHFKNQALDFATANDGSLDEIFLYGDGSVLNPYSTTAPTTYEADDVLLEDKKIAWGEDKDGEPIIWKVVETRETVAGKDVYGVSVPFENDATHDGLEHGSVKLVLDDPAQLDKIKIDDLEDDSKDRDFLDNFSDFSRSFSLICKHSNKNYISRKAVIPVNFCDTFAIEFHVINIFLSDCSKQNQAVRGCTNVLIVHKMVK
jgi:hypothetical protein